MVLGKFWGQSPKKAIIHKDIEEEKALIHIERLEKSFSQISSLISGHKDLNTILEVIVRDALNSLEAHRCTLFLMQEKTGGLQTQFTFASDRFYEDLGLNEEKEVAWKTFQMNNPLLLRKPEDFSEFFKLRQQERKITSLMSIPLSSQGKRVGVLSVVLINQEKYGFDEKNLQLFSSFANLTSIAMEIAHVAEGVHKGEGIRMSYYPFVDDILHRLLSQPEEESQRMDSRIEKIQEDGKIDEKKFSEHQNEEKVTWIHGTITSKEESGVDRRKDERVEIKVRVEFEEKNCSFTKNLSKGGAFIQTPDPLELGDQFRLKLHMPDGREPIEVHCKVIWTNKYAKETLALPKGMGVKFFNLEPEAQKRIEEYIESHKNVQESSRTKNSKIFSTKPMKLDEKIRK